ncbi:hypothetical protein C7441_110178 [Pseudaminobacter salicylatoxidans]|uniref:Panthothenate synthetase n=1 Tax=Pseudaminobacter salicylatoxidans TaxID=93369 RepID=A0A316C0X9_PSESE|nr:hypothetical protein [Pseudaminobacter salicylatoxidans]PWJ81642.1 hypothetical protein C7441_110178 [Pseudaminobacter salicylatoxidans]
MRMLLKVSIPVAEGNRAIKDGSLPKIIEKLLGQLQPEAAYFTLESGNRTAFIVFDLKDTTAMPAIAEPLFMGFNATMDMMPVMNVEDMRTGLKAMLEAM